jgi:prepilin-type N-terminal cleavage/methylation domain-containing protein
MKSLKSDSTGFTIIELMIATAVLSIIIVIVSVMMISIGNLFYKGVNQARIQDSVRTITDQVSQDLKYNNSFNASLPYMVSADGASYSIQAYCMGNTRYSYAVGYRLGMTGQSDPGSTTNDQISHVLWRDDGTDTIDEVPSGTGACIPINLTQQAFSSTQMKGGTELMAANSRLTDFVIQPISAGVYNVSVAAAYGDADLLIAPLTGNQNPLCTGGSGDRFCATAHLETTVAQRIAQGT